MQNLKSCKRCRVASDTLWGPLDMSQGHRGLLASLMHLPTTYHKPTIHTKPTRKYQSNIYIRHLYAIANTMPQTNSYTKPTKKYQSNTPTISYASANNRPQTPIWYYQYNINQITSEIKAKPFKTNSLQTYRILETISIIIWAGSLSLWSCSMFML